MAGMSLLHLVLALHQPLARRTGVSLTQQNLTSSSSSRSEAVFREAAELVSQLGTVVKVSWLLLLLKNFLCQQLGIVTHPDDAV